MATDYQRAVIIFLQLYGATPYESSHATHRDGQRWARLIYCA